MFIVMVRLTVKNMFCVRVIIQILNFEFMIKGKDIGIGVCVKIQGYDLNYEKSDARYENGEKKTKPMTEQFAKGQSKRS